MQITIVLCEAHDSIKIPTNCCLPMFFSPIFIRSLSVIQYQNHFHRFVQSRDTLLCVQPKCNNKTAFTVRFAAETEIRSISIQLVLVRISDATILVFGIRYDIDTILPKYCDIDMISIFYK